MKIIFLNAWGAKLREPFTRFIEEQSADTDVFCFQEAYDGMRALMKELLPGHREIAAYKYVTDDDTFPQATYIRPGVPLLDSKVVFDGEPGIGLGIYAKVPSGDGHLHIGNFHGMSRPVDKLDDPARLRQSERLIDFFKGKPGPKVIGGDFNLLPDTRSVLMFGENGYRDLIREFHIPTTRNEIAWAKFPDSKQYFSDYAFISPEVKLKSFSVPDSEISDHLPLILEIETKE
ncbi:MAG TPA: endonuclease/exonuclease/phosphatase family protein [Candidatus Paceibacterota bacterium]|nr:endonuclease/exonuclease/phosphatase family protein [Candidatus Paceibacterota bacterium]